MLEIIKEVPLFNQLSSKEIQGFLTKGYIFPKSYLKGATVYNQKDPCQSLDLVLKGEFIAYSLAESGSEMTIFEFKPGQVLGANLLFGDNNAYPFSIYCQNKGELLHINEKAIASFLKNYDFTMKFVAMISQNSQRLNQKITMVTQKTLRENLLDYLRQEARLQGSKNIILPISKKQLADYLGVQRPSLFRELKNLKDLDLIQVNNRQIYLKNI